MLGSKRRRIQTETLPTIAPNRAEDRSDGILCPMVKLIGVAVCLLAFVGGTCHGQSQAPASSTLVLSLKTMSKALGVCRVAYEQHQSGSNTPMVKAVIGASDYQKDMTGLGNAEKLVGIMIAHPDRITGQTLVATLSTSDDFYAGVGSTRLAILGKLIATKGASDPSTDELMVASTSLADCQTALFNAGDDFVGLVLDFVGAEDDAVAKVNRR